MSFDLYYPSDPWAGNLQTNQRQWYDPMLQEMFRRQAIYNRFVTSQFPLTSGPVVAPSMTVTTLIPPHPNFNPIGLRQLWMQSSYTDTMARTIEFQRYGSKLAYHKYDDLITYWKLNGNRGLSRIINSGLGFQMVEIMDHLARNAFLTGALNNGYSMFGTGADTDFGDLGSTDKLTTPMIQDLHLGMTERDVPYASAPSGVQGNIICVTTPGVVRDIKNEASAGGNANAFIDVMRYADPTRIINGEIGTYQNVRFVQTTRAMLRNCGTITHQANIISAVTAGSGSPAPNSNNKVDGVFSVGQPSGVSNVIAVNDVAGFSINDIVTVHTQRTDAYGVTNGVNFNDGLLHNRRIVAIDGGANTLSFDLPIMVDLNINLGAGVYGYVTLARDVHSAVFLGGSDGVVMGVGQAPAVYTPAPIDDYESMYRVSFDMFVGYKPWEPRVFEVWFGSGRNRYKGQARD